MNIAKEDIKLSLLADIIKKPRNPRKSTELKKIIIVKAIHQDSPLQIYIYTIYNSTIQYTIVLHIYKNSFPKNRGKH